METNIAAVSADIWRESEGNKHRQKRRPGQRDEENCSLWEELDTENS